MPGCWEESRWPFKLRLNSGEAGHEGFNTKSPRHQEDTKKAEPARRRHERACIAVFDLLCVLVT
jgi:hypothetical protein